eukprot:249012_1
MGNSSSLSLENEANEPKSSDNQYNREFKNDKNDKMLLTSGFIHKLHTSVANSKPTYTLCTYLPVSIIHICFKYYYIATQWDHKNKSNYIQIDTDTNSAFHKCPGHREWSNLFLKPIIQAGQHHFKFQILNIDGSLWFNIGIWLDNGKQPARNYWLQNNYYAFILNEAETLKPSIGSRRMEKYAVKCKKNDIVEMFVDLDASIMKFTINGKDYGIAYKNIPEGKYRPVIHMCARDEAIKLLT